MYATNDVIELLPIDMKLLDSLSRAVMSAKSADPKKVASKSASQLGKLVTVWLEQNPGSRVRIVEQAVSVAVGNSAHDTRAIDGRRFAKAVKGDTFNAAGILEALVSGLVANQPLARTGELDELANRVAAEYQEDQDLEAWARTLVGSTGRITD